MFSKKIKHKYIYELKARMALSIFVIYSFVLLSTYNLVIEIVTTFYKKNEAPTTFITVIILIIFASCLFFMIRHMKYPLSFFGFNLNHWKKYLIESLLFTMLFCLLLVGLKWILITYFSDFQHATLFFHNKKFSNTAWIFAAFLYGLFAFVQAFIIQGAIQSSLMELIKLRYASLSSIIVSALVFSSVHVDLNLVYALSVFIPGLFWATMYARQRSLLGVSVSHAIIGLWAFWGLGFQQIFKIISEQLRVF